MRERLLAIHRQTPLDGSHGREGMHVIRCGNDDCVDVPHLVQHNAVVLEGTCLRVFLERARGVAPINVAQRYNVLSGELAQIVSSLAGNADPGNVELRTGRGLASETQYSSRDDLNGACG